MGINPAAAKTAYTDPANWVRDGGVNDGSGTNNPEWPAIGATADVNSPLAGKTALTIGPNVVFNDANGRVNATEATGTPVAISGLGNGATAVVTFQSSGGAATVTGSFSANGTVNVNLSPLPDGTVTVTQMVVTSGGTPTTLTNPSPASTVVLDETAPTATTTIGLVADTGTAGDGVTSNPALGGTISNGNSGQTITSRTAPRCSAPPPPAPAAPGASPMPVPARPRTATPRR